MAAGWIYAAGGFRRRLEQNLENQQQKKKMKIKTENNYPEGVIVYLRTVEI